MWEQGRLSVTWWSGGTGTGKPLPPQWVWLSLAGLPSEPRFLYPSWQCNNGFFSSAVATDGSGTRRKHLTIRY